MPRVIAHRGASAARPENTVAAFAHAAVLGADAVELDVRRAADGRLVVSHDPHYPDGRVVAEVAWTDRPPGVCSLEEAVEAAGDLVVNAEIKNLPGEPGYEADDAIADDVVARLAELGGGDRFLISSFNPATLERVRRCDGAPRTALLTYGGVWDADHVRQLAVTEGHAALHPHDHEVDADYVQRAHALGLEVNVWTVNDRERIGELATLGVDGIVTDVPDVAREVLGPTADGAPARSAEADR